jgi:hypothetical protein
VGINWCFKELFFFHLSADRQAQSEALGISLENVFTKVGMNVKPRAIFN